MNTKNSIKLGKLMGIEIGFDYSWLLILALVTWALAEDYMAANAGWSTALRWGLAIITSLLFFASVLAHELAHSVVSNAEGVPVSRITLYFFGGASQMTEEPHRARDEFWIALVGPLTNLGLGLVFGVIWYLTQTASPPLSAMTAWLAAMNVMLAVVNLLPGFPLDGGRVLQSIVWGITKSYRRATQVAAGAGVVIAWFMVMAGVWLVLGGDWADGLWIAFFGWMMQTAAMQQGRVTALQDLLKGHTLREVPLSTCPHVLKQLSLDVFAENVVRPGGPRCFAVMEGDKFLGLLTTHRLDQVPKNKWPTTRISDVMIPPDQLQVGRPDQELSQVLESMTRADINQLPVLEDGRLLGVVTRADIIAFLQRLAQQHSRTPAPQLRGRNP